MSNHYTRNELQAEIDRSNELQTQVEGLIMERDALKAEVERLRAVVAELVETEADDAVVERVTAERAQLDAAEGWQKCGYPDTPEEGENVVWSEADIATWPGQWVGHYNPRQADSFQGLWYLRLPAPPQE